MIEKLFMDFITFLISNADKISAAIGIIIVVVILAYLVNEIGKRTEAQSQRDDVFKSQLLDLHTRALGNNERIVTLLEVHEKAALERFNAQEARDKERLEFLRQQTEAMTKITDNLSIISETKTAIDRIRDSQVTIEGSVKQVGTDVTEYVNRRANENLQGMKKAVENSFQLVENALRKMQPRLDGIAEIQDSHVEAQGQRHSELLSEIKAVMSALVTVNMVVDNAYQLLQRIQLLSPPEIAEPPALPETHTEPHNDTLKSA